MAEFIAFKLYGRDFRYYDDTRIECEFRNVRNNWRPMGISNCKLYKIIQFNIDKKSHKMMLHRVIYYVHNQDWDIYDNSRDNCIDHIRHTAGEPLDNSITNLRVVTNHQNTFNTNAKGYFWDKLTKKWRAKIHINGRTINLGLFSIESDARDAYLKAKNIYHIIN
jgi:hypothetical protein